MGAKNSTAVSTIPKAQATGRLNVVTEAHVTEISVKGDGRVNGVTYLKDGESYFQPATIVLLATYTYENVRTLLLSKSKAYPNGLSNNHGQVGKHYLSHNTGAGVLALFPSSLNTWYGLPAQGIAVDNWADDNFDHADLDFVGGGNLWVYTERHPIAAARMNTFGRAPRWGSRWKAFIKENADRWTGSYLQKTTLPYEDNYLDLHPTVRDPLGFPVCRITADFKDNEKRAAAFIQEKMVEWFMEAGAVETVKQSIGTMGPTTHAYGGTRMGDDADTNVVDRWGFSHEAPNLGDPRRVGDGDERRTQPHPNRSGARVAYSRSPRRELAYDLELRESFQRSPPRDFAPDLAKPRLAVCAAEAIPLAPVSVFPPSKISIEPASTSFWTRGCAAASSRSCPILPGPR